MDQTQKLLEEVERAEARLKQIERGLERSHRLATLGLLASSVAHEFNNLLTPIVSYCQMALASPEDSAMAKSPRCNASRPFWRSPSNRFR